MEQLFPSDVKDKDAGDSANDSGQEPDSTVVTPSFDLTPWLRSSERQDRLAAMRVLQALRDPTLVAKYLPIFLEGRKNLLRFSYEHSNPGEQQEEIKVAEDVVLHGLKDRQGLKLLLQDREFRLEALAMRRILDLADLTLAIDLLQERNPNLRAAGCELIRLMLVAQGARRKRLLLPLYEKDPSPMVRAAALKGLTFIISSAAQADHHEHSGAGTSETAGLHSSFQQTTVASESKKRDHSGELQSVTSSTASSGNIHKVQPRCDAAAPRKLSFGGSGNTAVTYAHHLFDPASEKASLALQWTQCLSRASQMQKRHFQSLLQLLVDRISSEPLSNLMRPRDAASTLPLLALIETLARVHVVTPHFDLEADTAAVGGLSSVLLRLVTSVITSVIGEDMSLGLKNGVCRLFGLWMRHDEKVRHILFNEIKLFDRLREEITRVDKPHAARRLLFRRTMARCAAALGNVEHFATPAATKGMNKAGYLKIVLMLEHLPFLEEPLSSTAAPLGQAVFAMLEEPQIRGLATQAVARSRVSPVQLTEVWKKHPGSFFLPNAAEIIHHGKIALEVDKCLGYMGRAMHDEIGVVKALQGLAKADNYDLFAQEPAALVPAASHAAARNYVAMFMAAFGKIVPNYGRPQKRPGYEHEITKIKRVVLANIVERIGTTSPLLVLSPATQTEEEQELLMPARAVELRLPALKESLRLLDLLLVLMETIRGRCPDLASREDSREMFRTLRKVCAASPQPAEGPFAQNICPESRCETYGRVIRRAACTLLDEQTKAELLWGPTTTSPAAPSHGTVGGRPSTTGISVVLESKATGPVVELPLEVHDVLVSADPAAALVKRTPDDDLETVWAPSARKSAQEYLKVWLDAVQSANLAVVARGEADRVGALVRRSGATEGDVSATWTQSALALRELVRKDEDAKQEQRQQMHARDNPPTSAAVAVYQYLRGSSTSVDQQHKRSSEQGAGARTVPSWLPTEGVSLEDANAFELVFWNCVEQSATTSAYQGAAHVAGANKAQISQKCFASLAERTDWNPVYQASLTGVLRRNPNLAGVVASFQSSSPRGALQQDKHTLQAIRRILADAFELHAFPRNDRRKPVVSSFSLSHQQRLLAKVLAADDFAAQQETSTSTLLSYYLGTLFPETEALGSDEVPETIALEYQQLDLTQEDHVLRQIWRTTTTEEPSTSFSGNPLQLRSTACAENSKYHEDRELYVLAPGELAKAEDSVARRPQCAAESLLQVLDGKVLVEVVEQVPKQAASVRRRAAESAWSHFGLSIFQSRFLPQLPRTVDLFIYAGRHSAIVDLVQQHAQSLLQRIDVDKQVRGVATTGAAPAADSDAGSHDLVVAQADIAQHLGAALAVLARTADATEDTEALAESLITKLNSRWWDDVVDFVAIQIVEFLGVFRPAALVAVYERLREERPGKRGRPRVRSAILRKVTASAEAGFDDETRKVVQEFFRCEVLQKSIRASFINFTFQQIDKDDPNPPCGDRDSCVEEVQQLVGFAATILPSREVAAGHQQAPSASTTRTTVTSVGIEVSGECKPSDIYEYLFRVLVDSPNHDLHRLHGDLGLFVAGALLRTGSHVREVAQLLVGRAVDEAVSPDDGAELTEETRFAAFLDAVPEINAGDLEEQVLKELVLYRLLTSALKVKTRGLRILARAPPAKVSENLQLQFLPILERIAKSASEPENLRVMACRIMARWRLGGKWATEVLATTDNESVSYACAVSLPSPLPEPLARALLLNLDPKMKTVRLQTVRSSLRAFERGVAQPERFLRPIVDFSFGHADPWVRRWGRQAVGKALHGTTEQDAALLSSFLTGGQAFWQTAKGEPETVVAAALALVRTCRECSSCCATLDFEALVASMVHNRRQPKMVKIAACALFQAVWPSKSVEVLQPFEADEDTDVRNAVNLQNRRGNAQVAKGSTEKEAWFALRAASPAAQARGLPEVLPSLSATDRSLTMRRAHFWVRRVSQSNSHAEVAGKK
ncbi:unnamed protein product [Amoebophrya sp. A120]|nr:unnamed protein product [Amoebophrya sp. A120]|eukprot:GSA120T00001977001.1